MSKVADSIRRGLQEAVAHATGAADESTYRIHVPERIDVKAIRTSLGMTQDEFAGGPFGVGAAARRRGQARGSTDRAIRSRVS